MSTNEVEFNKLDNSIKAEHEEYTKLSVVDSKLTKRNNKRKNDAMKDANNNKEINSDDSEDEIVNIMD
jgi:hypothetical protein